MLGHLFTTQTSGINSVAFSPNGKILASGSNDATTQLWNVADAAKPTAIGQALNSHDGAVFSVAFSPDGSMLATGDYDDTIRLFDVSDPARPALIAGPLDSQAMNICRNCAVDGADTENARYTAAMSPMSDCHRIFSRADSPRGLRCTTLR